MLIFSKEGTRYRITKEILQDKNKKEKMLECVDFKTIILYNC